MTGQIRITPETMRKHARDIDRYTDQMNELIRNMDSLLSTLREEWEGQAMDGYSHRYDEIKPSFANARDLFVEVSNNLTTTAKIIEDTDINIKNQFEGVK